MNIFITGASSGVARSLIPALCEDTSVTSVRGFDLRDSPWRHAKYQHIQGDMCSADLRPLMEGSQAVIHLAFAVLKAQHDEAGHRTNNVMGSFRVLKIASALRIPKIINLSSVSVYGQGQHLAESAPLNPSPAFSYAQHKADIERMTMQSLPKVIHLRSHLILGPHAQPFLHDLCNAPVYIRPPKPYPTLQIVHEDDVAQAIVLSLKHEVHGAYNVAAPEIVALPDLVKHQRSAAILPLPLGLVRWAANVARRLGHRDEFTWLDVMGTTLTVDCTRVQRELGWRPEYSAWQARASMVSKQAY